MEASPQPRMAESLPPSPTQQEWFDFYGLKVRVRSSDPEALNEVCRDFSYFRQSAAVGPANVQIELSVAAPRYEGLPSIPASFLTPRNVCYQQAGVSYIDYFGRGLAVYDRAEKRCVMEAADLDLAREMVYLFMLSTVGEHLDRRGLHRLHALGINHRGRAVLLALPSGGGKSTMALQLLKRPGFTLLAEDTPLIDRQGVVHPFPLRMGVRWETAPDIPPRYLRTVNRMEFDPKTLIDVEYFADKISGPAEPEMILIGQRNLGDASEILPLSRARAFKGLLKYMVVGLGIYQGMEFLLERGTYEVLGKGGVVASRLYNALRLLSRARAYRFVLGRNVDRNCQTLLRFLEERPG